MDIRRDIYQDHFKENHVSEEVVNRFFYLCEAMENRGATLNLIRCMHMAMHGYGIKYEIRRYESITLHDIDLAIEILELLDGFIFWVKNMPEEEQYYVAYELIPIKKES